MAFEDAMADGMRMSGVPSEYRHVPPRPFRGERPWAYVTGPVGTGKTYRACQALRAFIEDGAVEWAEGAWAYPKCRFIRAGEYLDEVKRAYDTGDSGVVDAIRDMPLLVIDDLGQEVPTAWAAERMFDLIDHRYSEGLRTVITSQFDRPALARRLAENGGKEQAVAIASRLAQRCEVVEMAGGDRRVVA